MKSSAEFNNLAELESAIKGFRSSGVPDDAVPSLSRTRDGLFTLTFQFTLPSA